MSVPANQVMSPNSSGVEARRDPPGGDPASEAVAANQFAEIAGEFELEDKGGEVASPPPPNEPPADGPVSSLTPAVPAAPAPVVEPSPSAAAAPPVAAVAETPPTSAPVAAPAVPGAPETPPAPAAQPVAGATPQTPSGDQGSLKPMSQEDIQKWMTESSESLAKEYYSMSPDRVAEFNLNPGEVLPKMLADVHMTVLTSVTQAIVHQLPSLMQTVYETSQSVSEGEKMFYDAWPTLKERKNQVHADAVRLAVDYRARNPNATPEQVIRDVGAMVHMQHRIPVPDMLGGAQGETPSVAPYQPAQGGGVPTSTPRAPTNQIDQLVQEFLVEDA